MEYLKFEKKDNIGIIKINNPESLNALNSKMLIELEQLLLDISSDNHIRVLVITGIGKAFAAGANIKEFQSMTPYEAKEYAAYGKSIFALIENFPTPVISAVNGYALGGGLELVLSTDFTYASEKALLGLPELTLGLIPGFGGCKRLSDRIGIQLAKELIFTASMLDAQQALNIGLITKVTKPEELMDEVFKTAEEIQKFSPNAVKEVKELLNSCKDYSFDQVAEIENNKFGLIFSHAEAIEGIAAFVNKHKK
ncbi:MAG TPA: enoyl-CoA hydratase/isomerase family protein [Victivallales bacterium]|nr:enoyl-CoA hydratase/isomerase family protein [Victivallales bacterium]